MPTITFDQLNGKGILNPITFNANRTYNITMGAPTCSGSAYFTMEATRDGDGFFDGFSPQPSKANFTNFVNISKDTLIVNKSPGQFGNHVWSIVIPPGGGTFDYFPLTTTFNGTVFLRGTGGITFTYSGFEFLTKAELQAAVNLWISDNATALATYGEINNWNVTAITDMSQLFQNKTTFNSSISNWDVSNVTDMSFMFNGATIFNQPIRNWNVQQVVNMESMFKGADAFQQEIDFWNVASLTNGIEFMGLTVGSGALNYTLLDSLYNGWIISLATLQPNITIDFGDSTFTSGGGQSAKNILVNNKGWTITDGGLA